MLDRSLEYNRDLEVRRLRDRVVQLEQGQEELTGAQTTMHALVVELVEKLQEAGIEV